MIDTYDIIGTEDSLEIYIIELYVTNRYDWSFSVPSLIYLILSHEEDPNIRRENMFNLLLDVYELTGKLR